MADLGAAKDCLTGNVGETLPVLFYDFNKPPREDGLYRVSLRSWSLWPLAIGDKIVFGCPSDEIEKTGRIRLVESVTSSVLVEALDG